MGYFISASILAVLVFMFASASAQSTYCTSATNMSTGQEIIFNLDGVSYHAVQNFITPNDAGLTINGVSHTLLPNVSVTMDQSTGAYEELTQINYIPIQPSVNFIVCSSPQGPDTSYAFNLSDNSYGDLYFQYFGATLVVSSNSNAYTQTTVIMSNSTDITPAPPSGYAKVAYTYSITGSSSTDVTVLKKIPCGLSSGSVYVEGLRNGQWIQINSARYDSSACTASADVSGFSTFGIFYSGSQATTVPTTTLPTTSTSTSTSTIHTTTIPTTQSTTTTRRSTSTTSTVSTSTTSQSTTTSIHTTTSTSVRTTIPSQSIIPSNSYISELPSLAGYATVATIAILLFYLLVIYLLYLILHSR